MSRARTAPRVRDGGSEAGTRRAGGHGEGPSHPGIPGAPRRPCRAGSQVPTPTAPTAPHLTLPEPLPPPQSERPQPPRSQPFSPQPPQPPRRASADSAASQAQYVTSGLGGTAFRAQASCGLAGVDGLPEVVGGVWASPVRLHPG